MPVYSVQTDYPIAFDSPDHLYPFGTMQDNNTDLGFITEIEELIEHRPIRHLDLGCSGGKLVHDMLDRGHEAVGLEGSDYSLKHGRAEWPALAGLALFTCDITRPYIVRRDGVPARFDLVTAWEVLEHPAEDRLPMLLALCLEHMVPGGWFIGSVSSSTDYGLGGGELHQTQQPLEWWDALFDQFFERHPYRLDHCVRLGQTCNFMLQKRIDL